MFKIIEEAWDMSNEELKPNYKSGIVKQNDV